MKKVPAGLLIAGCLLFSALPAVQVLGAGSPGLVYSEYGRQAAFVTKKGGQALRVSPQKDARKTAQADYAELLWICEEDYEGTGWDQINYHGQILYCPQEALAEEDPAGKTLVTTSREYYEDAAGDYEKSGDELQVSQLKGLSRKKIIARVGPIFTRDMERSGILASVSLAQFILESDSGKSELAQEANNCFGMKADLSGNTWEGSTWDGESVYRKRTSEQVGSGYVNITADFRAYDSISDSIADHSAYLAGARTDGGLRYPGLAGCRDYAQAAAIIKEGGYATSNDYVKNLCRLIRKYDLTRFDG